MVAREERHSEINNHFQSFGPTSIKFTLSCHVTGVVLLWIVCFHGLLLVYLELSYIQCTTLHIHIICWIQQIEILVINSVNALSNWNSTWYIYKESNDEHEKMLQKKSIPLTNTSSSKWLEPPSTPSFNINNTTPLVTSPISCFPPIALSQEWLLFLRSPPKPSEHFGSDKVETKDVPELGIRAAGQDGEDDNESNAQKLHQGDQ